MHFGLSLPPRLAIEETIKIAIKTDKSLFEAVWYGELFYNYSATVMLSLIATKTTNIKLGLFTNPYHINPAITASIGCSLAELSKSRFILGLGGGDIPTLQSIGILPSRLAASIRDSIFIIQKLVNGKEVSYLGQNFQTKYARLRYQPIPFPILIGGQGPRMMRLSLEIADGFLLNSSSSRDIEFFHKMRETNNRSKVDIIPYVLFEISSTPSKSLLMVVARVVAGASHQALKRLNFDSDLVDKIRKYVFLGKGLEATTFIDQDILDHFAIVGNLEECTRRIEAFRKLGVKRIILGGTLDPQNFNYGLNVVMKHILPSFSENSIFRKD